MLNQETKKKIFSARDILVGKIPDPKAQVEQITTALIYKFMDDMDKESEELGGEPLFFTGEYQKYAWSNLVNTRLGGDERVKLYIEALEEMPQNPNLPQLFRDILKNAFLPYRDAETLWLFLKEINGFSYEHSEQLGDAFEYLLSILGSQGDAGQFRTPRHIIDFMVAVLDPKKDEIILDPACGTAGFLISSYKHILKQNMIHTPGDQLTPDEKTKLMSHFIGYDISPDMVRLSLVNMYLHGFQNPIVHEYDTLTSENRWDETADVIIANPPFMSPKGGIRPHQRFYIKAKRSEILFVDYIAEHLNVNGRAGVIVPEGVIFQSGTSYKALRKWLLEKYIYAVVSLPAGVFNPYSGVKTSILFLDKGLAKATNNLLFVKVENDGFDLGAQRKAIKKNDLPEALHALQSHAQAIRNNVDFALTAKSQGTSKMLLIEAKSTIAKKGDYNLSGDRYKAVIRNAKQKWPMVELGEICEIERGASPRPIDKYITDDPNGVNWVKIGDTKNSDKYIVRTAEKITLEGAEKSRKVFVGDFVLSNSMSFGRPYIMKIEGYIHDGWLRLKEDSSRINKDFMYYILGSDAVREQFERAATGGVVRNLNSELVRRVEIPLPALEVQQEIVAELGSYQKVIEGAKQVVENYKPTIKDQTKFELVALEDLIEFVSGLTLSIPDSEDENGTPIISINNVTEDGEITLDGLRKIKLPNQKTINYLRKGDLLFNWRNGSKHLVGKTAYFDLEGAYVFASFLLGIRTNKDNLLPKYLWYVLNLYRREDKYMQFMRQNVNGLFNREELKLVKIPFPPLKIQEQIVTQLDEESSLIETNKKLIALFEQKLNDKINEVWGYEDEIIPTEAEIEEIDIEEREEMQIEEPDIKQEPLFSSF